jgi:hypothetical protein
MQAPLRHIVFMQITLVHPGYSTHKPYVGMGRGYRCVGVEPVLHNEESVDGRPSC